LVVARRGVHTSNGGLLPSDRLDMFLRALVGQPLRHSSENQRRVRAERGPMGIAGPGPRMMMELAHAADCRTVAARVTPNTTGIPPRAAGYQRHDKFTPLR